MSKQTICLNMIVKNESHIIEKTLVNILEHVKIDYWVISDTGSTDNTVDIITSFFKKRNIPGEIFNDEWRDFGYNRTKAIEHAYNKTDYLFIFDADDLIVGKIPFPQILDKDEYSLNFDGNSYCRRILISNRMKWKYVGVLHELLQKEEDKAHTSQYIFGKYHVQSRRLGARNHNPHKYRDDGIILEKAIENEKDIGLKNRYIFYCGQSYECAGNEYNDKAIKYSEMYLKEGDCDQHKFNSCIRLANVYREMGDIGKFLLYNNKSVQYDENRLEGIAANMQYYYDNGMHLQVSMYYNYFKDYKIDNKNQKLFYKQQQYNSFYLLNSISSSYISNNEYRKTGYDCCKHILLNEDLFGIGIIDVTITNLRCYLNNFYQDTENEDLIKWMINYMINTTKSGYRGQQRPNLVKRLLEYCNNSIVKKFPKDFELINKLRNKTNIIKKAEYSKSKNILIYTGYMSFLWNDSTMNKQAIGGAEKAVIYLTRNLPKNYTIYIAGDQKEEEIGNIKYINHSNLQKLLDNTIFHSIIVSRYVSFFKEFDNIKCYKMLLSAHDSTGFINFKVKNITINNILLEYDKYIDNVICLTKWHSSNIVERHPFLKEKINIINNGIDISQFIYDKPKVKNKFVWSSCSYRGLIILLNLWEELLESIPDATLDICSYDTFPKNKEDEKMLEIINKHSSITHHGKLNTKQLYELMSISEYWLYTNTFPETSCITAMEMLMSGAICLYYPLAGLVDTIGNYGIQVKSGNEIESLMSLSEERKTELIKNGKEYALTCSWKNRANRWCRVLNININTNKNIGIFNSFPFHYEMFGFILNYALNNDIEVDIFTNTQNDLGWIDFYKNKFNNFNVIDFKKFDGNTNNYSTFFVTTDDDPLFKTEWIDKNVVCLNHYYKIRAPNFEHYLNIANFKDGLLDYSYPCYPLINYNEKKQNNTVSIIGASYGFDFNIINKLYSCNKIQLNIFVRKSHNIDITELDTTKFNINFVEDIQTNNMIKLLKQSSYILINYNSHPQRENGMFCSGSLQLALSTLCRPIITQTSNKYLQIENVLEFDIDSNEPINIDGEIDFKAIEQERNKYIDMFDNYITKIKQKQVALIVEPRKLEKLDKIITNIHNKLNNNSKYKWGILFYCGKGLKTYYLSLFYDIDITIIELDTNNFTFMEYNDFLKSLSLWNTINSEYTLVFQADCYIFNNPPYTIDYFMDKKCSYIGGNMSYQWKELKYHKTNSQYRNFNGGLSLRKTKDMISIIQSFNPKQSIEKVDKFETYGEDVYFTIGAYKLNLKIGNTKDEQYFACHSIITDKCFGIHNSDAFLDKKQLLDIYPEIYNQSYIINDNVKKELVTKNMYINNDCWSVIEDDNIIFMETNEIDKEFLSNKKSPFVLVTANNLDYPSGHNNDIEILNNPYLIKWFGTFPAISHPKFSPLPLGPKANWKETRFLSEYMNTNIYDIASKDINPLVHNRKSLLYCNFSNTTSNPYIKDHKNCRIKLWEILKNIKIPVTNVKSQKDYLTDLSNYVYCLCPPGNGCDSHRLWEALMMNCIPVVIKYEPISELYKNLPVLVLDKWEDLTVELLNSKKEYFANFVFNRELIYKKYYIDKIKKEAEPICKLQSLQNKPKIIDCFTFYNELDMLTYRLNILNDVVDYFILVEATLTQVGRKKSLFYQDNKELFKEFNHKIIHIVVDDMPMKFDNINFSKNEQWLNEHFQRNCISRGIDKLSLQNNDVITITDLDEIPNPKILQQIKNNDIVVDINILELDFYYYNLNSKIDSKWPLSKIISYKNYKEKGLSCEQIRQNKSFTTIKNAGWHLSYFGDTKFIKNKVNNMADRFDNHNKFLGEKHIEERIKNSKDLFDRQNCNIINIDIKDNDNLPPKYDIYLRKFYNIQPTQTKKNIGFFLRHFTERGTEVSTYDYAHYNEKILQNKSYIIYFSDNTQKKYGFPDIKVSFPKFNSRFEMIEINDITDMKIVIEKYKLDFFYTQTHGGQDIYQFNKNSIWDKCKTIKHCVFNTLCTEGDYYLSLSNHLNNKFKTKHHILPYIVDLPNTDTHLRDELNIPHDAIVLGRYGGFHQFDLNIAHNAIKKFLDINKTNNVYFLFMNTVDFYHHQNIIYLDKNIDLLYKTKFINTCDAMIHARSDGETFGLAIAEFSIKNKPIITCPCGDLEHILLLGDKAIIYNNTEELTDILLNFNPEIESKKDWNAYKDYTPERVMKIFDKILNDNINICKNNKDYIINYNSNIKNIIDDPILMYPESAIVMSLDHLNIEQITYNDLNQENRIIHRTGGGAQEVILDGFITKTIFEIDPKINILCRSLDYPSLQKNIKKHKNINGTLIHFAKRYKEFEVDNDKIIHIPYRDDTYLRTIDNSINIESKINMCYWRGGCDLNGHLRHDVCKILKDSVFCNVKIFNPCYKNTQISTNIRDPWNEGKKYKIVLAIESVTCPADVENILFSGSIPIIIYRWWKAWFFDYINKEEDVYLIHYDEINTLPTLINDICTEKIDIQQRYNNIKTFINKVFNKSFIKLHLKKEINKLSTRPTVGLGILSYDRPNVLDQTLKSYKEKGFLDFFDEKIILLQENLPETRKVAEKYNLKIYSTENNIGIGPGNNFLINKLNTEYIIICQDDFNLTKNNYKKQIINAIKLIDNGHINCCRLRNLQNPGIPCYGAKRYIKPSGDLGKTHTSECLYYNFISNPDNMYPDVFNNYNTANKMWILDSAYSNYTENPCLYKRNWYIKNICKFNKLDGRKAENNVQSFWEKQKFKIGMGEGIFTHIDKVEE